LEVRAVPRLLLLIENSVRRLFFCSLLSHLVIAPSAAAFSFALLTAEISVLLARSALPLHSICAAIQSIGVVRRDVEQDSDYQIGWALLPAVALHGIFDFALLAFSFVSYIESPDTDGPYDISKDQYTDNNDDQIAFVETEDDPETLAEQAFGFTIGLAITVVGVIYYMVEAKKQRGRLQALEMTTAIVPSTIGRAVFA
jgi:hypothetical protein